MGGMGGIGSMGGAGGMRAMGAMGAMPMSPGLSHMGAGALRGPLGPMGGIGGYPDPYSNPRLGRRASDPMYNTFDPFRHSGPSEADVRAMRRSLHGQMHYNGSSDPNSSCEDCRSNGRQCRMDHGHRTGHHLGHRDHICDCGNHGCNRNLGLRETRSKKDTCDFKTKDITVRGISYSVRKSFLAESSKFESDLIKFMDKKTEEQVPDHVVQMLIDFINAEECTGRTILEYVILNVLASNLGAKSAVEHSLSELKKATSDYEYRANPEELTNVCVAVLMSSRVDSGLEAWLKKFLQSEQRSHGLTQSWHFQEVHEDHPELLVKLRELLETKKKADDAALPILS